VFLGLRFEYYVLRRGFFKTTQLFGSKLGGWDNKIRLTTLLFFIEVYVANPESCSKSGLIPQLYASNENDTTFA
jgi:hypothetical protein